MSWTTEYPTKPGYYWIRMASGKNPEVAYVAPDMALYIVGNNKPQSLSTPAEWQGPIEPERENVNRPTFKRALPEMACASCAKIATEYISWPTHKIGKDQYFSLICRKCWIERLTPEQREAYRV